MKRLSRKNQKWLKGFHILFACLWVGGAVSITLMSFFIKPTDGMQLYGVNLSIKFVDDFIIIPGAVGSLLTGLLYSLFTNWGWFKHNWISVKWVINIYGVVFGTFWLGPWQNSLPPIAKIEGMSSYSNPIYLHNQNMLYYWGTFQAITIVVAVFISILKPWKKREVKEKSS